MGALYLDQGQAKVRLFLKQQMFAKIDTGFYDQFVDYKTKLQELLQKNGNVQIKYQKLSHTTNQIDNKQIFKMAVEYNGNILGVGEGTSIKLAEKVAARVAYQKLTQK